MAPSTIGTDFTSLVEVMHRLRAPGGCPWDREQTPESLRPFLVEETCEVLDAIRAGDPAAICDELGDLLLQILFHAEMAAETGAFDIGDVVRALSAKLVRRHPHVFADASAANATEVMVNWERIKAAERGQQDGETFAADLPHTLPALARAQKLGRRAAKVGFDWADIDGVLEKLREEQAELEAAVAARDHVTAARELGDLLLTATSAARHLAADAEMALRDATDRLRDRLRVCADAARAEGQTLGDLDPAARDRLWALAKRRV